MADIDFHGRQMPQFIAGLAATFGGFTTGNALGWASPCIPLIEKKQMEDQGLNSRDDLDDTQKEINSLISGIQSLGAAFGLIIVAGLVDRIGRKWTMISFMPIAAGGYVILALVENNIGWLGGRFIAGMGTGLSCMVSPIYAWEIAQKRIRDKMVILFQINIVLGILYSYCLVYVSNYRLINWLMIIPIGIFVVVNIFMPQSPYFLLAKGKDDWARKALQRLRGKKTDIDQEFEFIKSEVTEEQTHEGTLEGLFRHKSTGIALGTCMILLFGQQLSGVNAVVFNMTRILRVADLELDPELLSIIVAIVQVVITIVAAYIVDMTGRRIMLLISFTIMIVCLGGLGGYFYCVKLKADMSKWTWVPVTSLCIYITGFSLGAGPVPFLMMDEVLPGEVRCIGMCLCIITKWLLSFLITKTFPNLEELFGTHGAFWVYGVCSIAILVLILFFIVETNLQTFTKIREVFEGKAPERAPRGLRTIKVK